MGDWADFERLCAARSLLRRTVTARGHPTVCIVLLLREEGQEAVWDVVRGVVDSAQFRPARKAYELLHAAWDSPVATRLRGRLGISDARTHTAVAFQLLHRHLAQLDDEVRAYPVDGEGWGSGDAASGAFGRFVVSLEEDRWQGSGE